MDVKRAKSFEIELKTPLKEGIHKTIKWYIANQNNKKINERYNSFKEFDT